MSPDRELAEIGLCSKCRHAAVQRNLRGSVFWRCRRGDDDPRFGKYPPLPVVACFGHEAGAPEESSGPEPQPRKPAG